MIYSLLPEVLNTRLSELIEQSIATDPEGTTGVVLICRNKYGGVDNPIPYINNPDRTIVIAGPPSEEGRQFADKALAKGVPETNVFFIPAGTQIDLGRIAACIRAFPKEKTEPAGITQPTGDPWADDPWAESPLVPEKPKIYPQSDVFPQTDVPASNRIKVLGVIGFRGGTGRTTIAASLAAHYSDIGEKVALIDLGKPRALERHIKNEPIDLYTNVNNLEELKLKYRRIIIDFSADGSAEEINALAPDKLVVVVDSDLVQTVEPAIGIQGVYVYNRAIPEVDHILISSLLGSDLIIIEPDLSGCYAALAESVPAYRKSSIIANGIGEIAASIG